jgi:hypothetical protein
MSSSGSSPRTSAVSSFWHTPGCRLHVAVASTDETGRVWQVFAFAELGLVARLRRSSADASAVSRLMTDLKRVLEESADVKSLREEPT